MTGRSFSCSDLAIFGCLSHARVHSDVSVATAGLFEIAEIVAASRVARATNLYIDTMLAGWKPPIGYDVSLDT